MSLWLHMINKLAIQPQIKHSQATITCQDHIKAFTHERPYMWHFQKHSYQTWIIHQDHQELSQTNHSIPKKLTKTHISFHGEQCVWEKLFLTNAYDTKCMQSKIQGSQ
jgi:hypothetical protein